LFLLKFLVLFLLLSVVFVELLTCKYVKHLCGKTKLRETR